MKKHMKDKKRILRRVGQVVFASLVTIIIISVLVFVTAGRSIPVLNPHGLIADQERNLIMVTLGLGLIVVVPVFIMLFSIAWRYRASNTKATYQPDFAGHRGIEALWWGIPCVIIITLAVITVIYTHALDPYKSIDSSVKPIKVQVVALQWKWLFIYPDEGIASLNYMNIPKDTPVDFTITSDAPMNSFWIPALAGQVYAMSGMTTQLHIMADTVGSYTGSSANISGEGFADMQFKVNVLDQSGFARWINASAASSHKLTSDLYQTLSKASRGDPETTYALMDSGLYNETIMKYMSVGSDGSMHMSGMSH
jgi:cytochrome o ubiquinol oxidase subunit 2